MKRLISKSQIQPMLISYQDVITEISKTELGKQLLDTSKYKRNAAFDNDFADFSSYGMKMDNEPHKYVLEFYEFISVHNNDVYTVIAIAEINKLNFRVKFYTKIEHGSISELINNDIDGITLVENIPYADLENAFYNLEALT